MTKQILIYVLVLMVLASCRIARPYVAPDPPANNLFRDSTGTDTTTIATLSWREIFSDTTLQNLIDSGIKNNLDLRAAYARIQQAESYYRQSKAAFFPSVDANTGVSISKLSEAQGFGIRTSATQYQIGISTAWEADIWGRLRSSKKAGFARLLQNIAATRAVQTSIVADIATLYYQLLALDEQVAITTMTVYNWDTTVTTMRALKEAATVTEAAVVQSEAQRYAAAVTIPDLRQNIREIENALSILLGRPPGPIPRSAIAAQQTIASLNTGIPAQLLANRPDVMEAEMNFRNFFELTNVARAFFYPTLSITGSSGLNSLSFGNLFDPASFVANIAGNLAQPIFNRRVNKTRLEVATAQQTEAFVFFQNTLLNAGREVSDALSLHTTALEKMQLRSLQMSALERSVEYSQELLKNGFANYTEIIQARQSLLQAELGRVNDRLQQLQATVNVYRSLGGGWR
ncbi:MAG: efflux transporter outer membrane subunit [Chitinophagaceae bacterium]|nr:MAG: efflux transporter outer membrane subunit [Chitinophagaceae bacterium]